MFEFLKRKKKQNKREIQWKKNSILPKINQEIVIYISDSIETGIFESDKYGAHVTIPGYLGMPFYSWKTVERWCSFEEFKQYLEQFK